MAVWGLNFGIGAIQDIFFVQVSAPSLSVPALCVGVHLLCCVSAIANKG